MVFQDRQLAGGPHADDLFVQRLPYASGSPIRQDEDLLPGLDRQADLDGVAGTRNQRMVQNLVAQGPSRPLDSARDPGPPGSLVIRGPLDGRDVHILKAAPLVRLF